MTTTDAFEGFEHLGGPWKRLADKSRNKKRLLPGSKDHGRWRAFSVGGWMRWRSVAENEGGKRRELTITGARASLTEFESCELGKTSGPEYGGNRRQDGLLADALKIACAGHAVLHRRTSSLAT
jgi:hypothetical protein